MNAFYDDPAVRQRLTEFLGGASLEAATADYITHSDGHAFAERELHPPDDLGWFLERKLDIARSLGDSQSLLIHLDVEYVNFDSVVEAYLDPWRAFELQEPVVRVIESLLLEWGIQPLHIITGQGHHFVWRLSLESAPARHLEELVPDPVAVKACLDRVPMALQSNHALPSQQAFAALSLVMEYVAHRIKDRAAALCRLPVELTAVHVGPVSTGRREIISLDVSEYGDPLHTRMVRMPFTNYLKPWVNGIAKSLGLEHEIPAITAIPLHEMDVWQAIKVRQVKSEVRELARRACVRIPEQREGTQRLLEEYLASSLRVFHQSFYSVQHDPKERWADTYGRTSLETLPPCCAHLASHPNDLLLKPAGMQMVTRCLLAKGWHPRHVAGFIRSKFEDPSWGWGVNWHDYDPGTRADFYTRIFAGLYACGLDRLVDFNCTSAREKGFCFPPLSGRCSLEPSCTALLRHFAT
jgi:hypothetical protein